MLDLQAVRTVKYDSLGGLYLDFGDIQEYLTGLLDKNPSRQAGIELAGKVKH